MQVPALGTILGFVPVYVVLTRALFELFGTEFPWQFVSLTIGWLFGGGIGGLIQLRKQGRTAEIPRFLRLLFLLLLQFLFLLMLPMFLAAWLGEKLYGNAGHWVGMVGSGVLIFSIRCWLARRSASDRRATTPLA
jgi:hypothetical protein